MRYASDIRNQQSVGVTSEAETIQNHTKTSKGYKNFSHYKGAIVFFTVEYCTKIISNSILSRIILTPTHHQRSPAHHIVPCTTLLLHITDGLHFPSTIALITSVTNHSLHWLHSWPWSHTLQKPWTSPLSLLSIVSPLPVCLSLFPCLFLSMIPWTVYSLLPVCCLFFFTLPAFWYPLCLPPAPTIALPLLMILPCLRYTCSRYWTLPVWPPLEFCE